MEEAKLLRDWYSDNRRSLPWRQNKDPYRIWISEMMLQQTTVQAVVPYYERFLQKFPTVKDLKNASLEQVLEMWSGLGYYSRARNIHKAAQVLGETGFPQSYEELLELPGFGPYTARAVASLAFQERVGVVDGNVIRVLSRYFGEARPWWKSTERNHYQSLADRWVQSEDPSLINQGLMELGATVCTPQSPVCLLCPLQKKCQARLKNLISVLPLKKPKKASEIWVWEASVCKKGQKIGLIQNDYLPFLRGQWIFPGRAKKVKQKPKTFDVKHGITHHDIYVRVQSARFSGKNIKWLKAQEIRQINPSSLLRKILESCESSSN